MRQVPSSHTSPAPNPPKPWQCASTVDQQSARAVSRLLAADETRQKGANIKSLTLAPHIEHKRATFAVTCETLKYLPLIRRLLESADVLAKHPRLLPATAYVLTYELLMGKGFGKQQVSTSLAPFQLPAQEPESSAPLSCSCCIALVLYFCIQSCALLSKYVFQSPVG